LTHDRPSAKLVVNDYRTKDDTLMSTAITIHTLEDLLAASQATPEFKDSVRTLAAGPSTLFMADGLPQSRVIFDAASPPVKVLRVVMKLLEEFPNEPFEKVTVDGRSGCSEYVGSLVAEPGDLHVQFTWDCAWRAQQQGWKDAFGFPDQIRAAREFGYQCFLRFDAERGPVSEAFREQESLRDESLA